MALCFLDQPAWQTCFSNPPRMKTAQILDSGIIISQDIKNSVRFVIYETGFTGWEYATHGGTLFIVSFKGRIYGVTCRHVFKDFDIKSLVVTNERLGRLVAGYNAIFFPTHPTHEAKDSDIVDIAVIRFNDDCQSEFFKNTAYVIDSKTVGSSTDNDRIIIEGTLKSESLIDESTIKAQYCSLEINDCGFSKSDPVLRNGIGQFNNEIGFSDIIGISGSPVFNRTKNILSGMVTRGCLNKNKECQIWYIDFFDILKVLEAIHEGKENAFYLKKVKR